MIQQMNKFAARGRDQAMALLQARRHLSGTFMRC